MHPFRDGAPFSLVLETPPTLVRSLRFLFNYYIETFCSLPFLFRHLWLPSISYHSDHFLASTVSSVPHLSMSHSSIFTVLTSYAAVVVYDHRPSHAYIAGKEHVGFSPTRQTLLAPITKRREVFSVAWRVSCVLLRRLCDSFEKGPPTRHHIMRL